MYSVLVLGLIPGTHIQISFLAWLIAAVVVSVFVSITRLERKRHQSTLWLASHYPKHANQLHQRGV
jgi:hypothetical protein